MVRSGIMADTVGRMSSDLELRAVLGHLGVRQGAVLSCDEIACALGIDQGNAAKIMDELLGDHLVLEETVGRFVLTSAGIDVAWAQGLVPASAARPVRIQNEPGF
jgi:hypothetical protein